jgi:DNA-binding transcriptional LysR family regulator
MTLRQLEVFLAIANAHSYRRAAEGLHASQPALSQHVRELEAELGVRLFDRLSRGVVPTEAGRLLEERAKRVFATLTDVRDVLGELQGLQRGLLLVGASTTPGIYVLPAVIGEFRRRYPGIDLRLRIANSRVIEEAIRAHEVDLGVVGGHGLAPGEECLAAGLADELVLIVSPRHRWAKRREIAPADSPTSRCWSARKARYPPRHRAALNRPGSARINELDHRGHQAGGHGRAGCRLSRCTPCGEVASRRLRRSGSAGFDPAPLANQRGTHAIGRARALVAMLSAPAKEAEAEACMFVDPHHWP